MTIDNIIREHFKLTLRDNFGVKILALTDKLYEDDSEATTILTDEEWEEVKEWLGKLV